MKKLSIIISFALASFAVNAQSVGVIIQPEFGTSVTRKGFFAESTIYKGVGLYTDFKIGKDNIKSGYYHKDQFHTQFNVGASVRVYKSFKLFASTSAINNTRVEEYHVFEGMKDDMIKYQGKAGSVYQGGIIYNTETLTLVLGYESGNRVTVGVGFKLF